MSNWLYCTQCKHKHWGRYGAAGLLLLCPTEDSFDVLMQYRSYDSDNGFCWGLPGGALYKGERPSMGALRETFEETGMSSHYIELLGERLSMKHLKWKYTTVFGITMSRLTPQVNHESLAVEWVDISRVALLPLHPALLSSWSLLKKDILQKVDVHVDEK